MTRREANIFACLTDAAVAPEAPLPAVAQTDAVVSFEQILSRSPALHRLGLRACLLALELGPAALGFGARLRRLGPAARLAYLERLQRGPMEPLAKALCGMAQLSYYGDESVMRLLGYDAAARVERGRALRRAEGRW